jgi:hypothetical protein
MSQFQTTADGTLEYRIDEPSNRIVIAIPYTAKKSFVMAVQRITLLFQEGKAEVIRVKDKVVGMTLSPDGPKTFNTLDQFPEKRDKVIRFLWDTVLAHPKLPEVPTIDGMAVNN